MLEAISITKQFGPVRALDAVDFSIEAGEIVTLAGENGSGKSTLARVLAGAHAPTAGELRLDGEPVAFATPRDALHRGIALVQQELTAVPAMSVAENVLLTRLPRGLARFRRGAFEHEAAAVLARVGLDDVDPGQSFQSLSTGAREMVEIAKALATSPRMLILDEATSRMSEADVDALFEILLRLKREGTSTVIITHRMKEMCTIADRAVILRDGRRVGELPRAQIDEDTLAAMMVGRELSEYFHKRSVPVGAPALELDGLVVEGSSAPLSLEVRSGEIVAIAGLVGAGRTELLETIFGARTPLGGSVRVDGEEIALGSPATALSAGIALVPEDRHRQGLNLLASIELNVSMGEWPTIGRVSAARERANGAEAIERLNIRATGPQAPVASLSGGNQQKVVIARCLNRNPRVLLLDEPTRGIDVGANGELFRLIGEMVASGMAIVLVSSDLMEVLGLADRVIVLHEREIAGEISRATATEEEIALLSAGGKERQS